MARGMVYSQVLLLMTLREKHVAVKKPCERGGNGLGVGFGPCRKRCLTGFPLKLGCGSWVVLYKSSWLPSLPPPPLPLSIPLPPLPLLKIEKLWD